ncbi:uncharacterized protein LOC127096252 [Lathyrus oleraceus]|uniref:uncharacterized protein LOC127096252 n=1 Tax=Pisum sativum TaxID=3888 RepID=UPI0021D3BDEE|nr:uncharacterized protein LOC127096252 [Pisum sativum]
MNSDRRGICSYKFVEPQLNTLRGLGTRLFYDPPMRCFTFQDYQLAPTLEEYSHILGVGIKNHVSFVSTKELPKSHLIIVALHLEKKEVEINLKLNGVTHSFTSKLLVDKVIAFADAGSWDAFNAILSLLIYGIVLFPNMEDFVDLAFIHIFMTKSLVPTLLDDTYYSIHVRNQKKKGTIVFCIPMLYKWFISHIPNKSPFVKNKGKPKWSQRIMSLTAENILWYSRSYNDVNIILNYGNFPNVPILCIKSGINYNPRLVLCQLGYPMLDKPDSEQLEDFVLYEGVDNWELLKKIIRVWGEIHPQGRVELGLRNCVAKEA